MAEIVKLKKDENPGLNKAKWGLLFIIFFAALVANYYYPMLANSLRLILWLVVAIILFAIFAWTRQGKRFFIFAKASRNEMRKVVWPTRQETIQSTVAVVALVAILALVLWLIDSFWLWLITLITG